MNTEKTVHVDTFVLETMSAIVEFHSLWYKKHQMNPEEYPLDLPEQNSGLWHEFFVNFLITGEI